MEYGMEVCYYPDWCYCVKIYLTHIYHSKICASMHLYAYMGNIVIIELIMILL